MNEELAYTDIIIMLLAQYPVSAYDYTAQITSVTVRNHGQNSWLGDYFFCWEIREKTTEKRVYTTPSFCDSGEQSYDTDIVRLYDNEGNVVAESILDFADYVTNPNRVDD